MLAGNVTSSVTQLARVMVHDDKPHLIDYEIYQNKDFSGIHSMLALYLRKKRIEEATVCFGVAGPVLNNSAKATNLDWRINGSELEEKYNFKQVKIINDLEATAYGLSHLNENKFFNINTGKKLQSGNIGIIAPGGGLGQCLIFYDGDKFRPVASEGGHSGFAPGTQLEIELWEYLYGMLGFVEAEDVVSLRGLERIYEFLLDSEQREASEWFVTATDKGGMIIENALSGSDETAVRAMDLFIDCFASEAANLALKGMTLGGIYLTGSLAPKIITAIDKGKFMERFIQKGKLGKLLANVPVDLIIEDKTAVLGAGSVSMELYNQ